MAALEKIDLSPSARVLDVGTGVGLFAIFLAVQGYDVLTGEPSTDTSVYAGKDWESNAVQFGVRENIRFEAFDASNMPYPAATFDAVFFFGVLHHIEENDRTAAILESLRVCRKKGAVVFFEPTIETLKKAWVKYPDHPPAANPFTYLRDKNISKTHIEGVMMDVFILEPTG